MIEVMIFTYCNRMQTFHELKAISFFCIKRMNFDLAEIRACDMCLALNNLGDPFCAATCALYAKMITNNMSIIC